MIDINYWTGIAVGIAWSRIIIDWETVERYRDRWLRPRKVRREYRAGIKQAQSVLRLIASTHYFEDNLDQTVNDFIPRGDDHYHRAFRRHFLPRAVSLRRTQRKWAGATK